MALENTEIVDRLSAIRQGHEQIRQSVGSIQSALEIEQEAIAALTKDVEAFQAGARVNPMPVRADALLERTGLERDPLAQQLINWAKGVSYEVEFWDRWFSLRGGEWPDDFQARLRSDTVFSYEAVDDLGLDAPKVLDVGAGPMTTLGKIYKGSPLSITAVDPLAVIYDVLADKYKIDRPVKTTQGFAEDLSAIFQPNSFDVVFCTNALDHSFDPMRGLEEMLLVCNIGGVVALEHQINEAEAEKYQGFHQWNFDTDERGHFIIWNQSQRWNATEHFESMAIVQTRRNENWLTVSAKKKSSPEINMANRYRSRLQELLTANLAATISLSGATSQE